MLLSVPSKILAKIITNRITTIIDECLREEQAGFRKGRGKSSRSKKEITVNDFFSYVTIMYTEQEYVAELEDKYASFMKLWGDIRKLVTP